MRIICLGAKKKTNAGQFASYGPMSKTDNWPEEELLVRINTTKYIKVAMAVDHNLDSDLKASTMASTSSFSAK